VSRFSAVLRLVAAGVILVGPIAVAAWDLRQAPRVGGTPAPVEEAQYLSRRNPVIDELLPNGQGGVRVVEHLDGKSGMAFTRVAAIALAAPVASEAWPGSVELHERAHLVDAFLPEVVALLMTRMPPPASGEYAATNDGEHFAEMASSAWELVVPPDNMCIEGTPVEALRAAEAKVPGTAGFVVWYLQHPALAGTELAGPLRPVAEELIASSRIEWDALWQALDERRLADHTFAPWRVQTVRDYITRERASARASGDWIASVALTPSLALLAAMGR